MSNSAKVLGPRSSSTSSLGSRSSSSSSSTASTASKASSQASSRSFSESIGGRKTPAEKEKEKAKPQDKKKTEKDTSKVKPPTAKARGKDKKDHKGPVDHYVAIPANTSWAKLGSLRECCGDPAAESDLLVKKLNACCEIYDFSKDDKQPDKDGKRLTLLEILEFLPAGEKKEKTEEKVKDAKKDKKDKKDKDKDKNKNKKGSDAGSNVDSVDESEGGRKLQLNKAITRALVDCVKANAFRTLTAQRERTPMDLLDGEDEDPFLEPTWPHLELVYEMLAKLLSSKDLDTSVAQQGGMDKHLLTGLLGLFESEDPREREVLKSLIIKFFNRIPPLRSSVRRGIQSFCMRAVYLEGAEAPQIGVAEVLEVLGSRVVGAFATPLKEEHKDLLLKVLLPLYKLDTLMFFYTQLKELVRVFCKKESILAKQVIFSLLRYWPVTAGAKQTVFLSEIEELFHMLPSSEVKHVTSPVVKRLAECIAQPNSEVAERALVFWRNSAMVRYTVQYSRDVMPTVVSGLYGNITKAWAGGVMAKTLEVLKNLMEADHELFDNSSSRHRKDGDEIEKKESLRLKRWAQLQALHEKKTKTQQKTMIRKSVEDADGTSKAWDDELMLKPDASCAVSLCWNRKLEANTNRLVLQALLVNSDGKVLDVVHDRNVTAMQSAVRLTCRAPAASAKKSGCNGTIWVSLEAFPSDIVLVIFTVSSSDGGRLGSVAKEPMLAVDTNGYNSLGEFDLDLHDDAKLACVAVLKRLDSSGWSFQPKNLVTKLCSHYMDFPEMLARVLREALPSLPRRQRMVVSMSAMEKGSVAELPVLRDGEANRRIFLGMGWDYYSPDETSNVDVSVVLFSADGQHLGTISKGNPEGIPGAMHTGDGALSAGVFAEPDTLPADVSMLFLVGHIDDPNMSYEIIQQPHCSIVDGTGREYARYNMPDDEGTSTCNGLIMARFFWNEVHDRWNFQALGIQCKARVWNDALDDMVAIVKQKPSTFQTLQLEDEDHIIKDHSFPRQISEDRSPVITSAEELGGVMVSL
eukprot:TRINITY_DN951_c1_g1_i2.p1 TRINITY_DN951_c1_g1~~TRINITY_DN951_c1_g1_i2.p1  ORF type:complete len:1028 (-),score=253.84 TRINITY_DN951_c1_g1_i2:195-3278(-)